DGRIRRIRIRRWADREPRYYVLPGSAMACMAHGLPARVAVVVESELDAIMLAGIAADLAAVVALGSATAKPGPELHHALAECALVLVALDSDRAGADAMRWWREHLPRSRRWPVPVGKDPGEAHAAGVDVRAWVEAGLPRGFVLGPSPMGLITGRAGECELKLAEGGKAATTGGGSAHTADEQAVAWQGGKPGASAPTISALDELAGLLRMHPVQIRVAPDGSRVHIRENQSWKAKNWDTARRISELVFQDCEVLDYLLHHGEEIITGRNLIKGVFKRDE
ncbi:MAG: toprim domain-containing protein, partial [Opitutaceae bacterium]